MGGYWRTITGDLREETTMRGIMIYNWSMCILLNSFRCLGKFFSYAVCRNNTLAEVFRSDSKITFWSRHLTDAFPLVLFSNKHHGRILLK